MITVHKLPDGTLRVSCRRVPRGLLRPTKQYVEWRTSGPGYASMDCGLIDGFDVLKLDGTFFQFAATRERAIQIITSYAEFHIHKEKKPWPG